jgi:hypothetical protein
MLVGILWVRSAQLTRTLWYLHLYDQTPVHSIKVKIICCAAIASSRVGLPCFARTGTYCCEHCR